MKRFYLTLLFITQIGLVFLPNHALLALQSPQIEGEPASYFAFLESIAALPAEQQAAKLRDYIAKQPGVEQAWFKLIELALLQDRLDTLQQEFQHWPDAIEARQNRHWALARIFALKKNQSRAMRAYRQAIAADAVPLQLWIDYFAFTYGKNPSADWRAGLPDPQVLQSGLLHGLQQYFSNQPAHAAETFASLPKSISHQPQLLYLWGSSFFDRALYAQADSLWRLGLKQAQANGDQQAEAQLLTSLAYAASQDYATIDFAEHYYQQAEQIARRIDDAYRLQLVLGNHATILEKPGNAITAFQEAISIAEKLQQFGDAAQWYMGLAQLYYFTERFALALQTYAAGEPVARRAGDRSVYVQMMRDKGDFYYDLHQDSLARKTYRDVLALAKELGLAQQEKSTRARLADDLLEAGAYERARIAYIDYIDFLSDPADFEARAYWQSRVAESFKRQGQHAKARDWFELALATARSGNDAFYENWLLLELAKLDLSNHLPRAALEKCRAIREYATEQSYNEMLWQAELAASKALQATGNTSGRIAALKDAAAAVEQTRQNLTVDQLQISYFSEAQQVYRQLVAAYLARLAEQPVAATRDTLFHYLQLTRGRTLNELGSGGATPAQDSGYVDIATKLRTIQRRMRDDRSARKQMQSAFEAARYALLTRRLRLAAHDTMHAVDQESAPLLLQEAKTQLSKLGTCLLLYHIAADSSFVFAISNSRTEIIGINIEPDSLQRQINALIAPLHQVQAVSIDSVVFRADLAHQLYQQLVAPVEQKLGAEMPQNVLIVPDIALMQLPFEMMLSTKPQKQRYLPADNPDYASAFLLHRWTISYSPSPAILRGQTAAQTMRPKVAIFANPFNSYALTSNLRSDRGWRFDALPYAEEEARRIEMLLGDDANIFLRDKASKRTFFEQAPHYPIIHFATHAFADPSFDAFSGLVLATTPDSSDDGLLMGYEIAGLGLQADLVALSACETGHGQLVSGEGVLGLPRLFLGAGARSVLMTRWVIDDAFASALLPEFYQYYLQKRQSKAEALSRAQKSLLQASSEQPHRHYQHPFYWASYALYGHPGHGSFATGSKFERNLTIACIILCLAAYSVFRIKKHRT